MKIMFFLLLITISGCGLSPERRQTIGTALYLGGNTWAQTQRDIAAQNVFWTNYRYQQQQLYLMQQQNNILQQRGYR